LKHLAVIPFSGFYSSWHESMLDDALNQMFSDDQGNVNSLLAFRAWDATRWQKVHEAYAKDYAETFAGTFDLPSLEFEELWSPREYNFTTDRIFVRISIEDIKRAWDRVDRELFTKVCEGMFTSRSGFSSFYNPDWTTWGDIEDWDHNQLLALLAALVDKEHWDEDGAMEFARCNGEFDNWIYEAMSEPERTRIFKVQDYLRVREERGS